MNLRHNHNEFTAKQLQKQEIPKFMGICENTLHKSEP